MITLLTMGCRQPNHLTLQQNWTVSFGLCTRNYMKGMIHDHSTHDGVPPTKPFDFTTELDRFIWPLHSKLYEGDDT